MREPPAISGTTRLYGIVGDPVKASLSPVMQNAAFRALGIDAVYVPFPVAADRLAAAVRGLAALGVEGFNVTVPHKQALLPLLDRVLPDALALGAVNTVRREGARLIGTNTDGEGFLLSLRRDLGWAPQGKHVLLLGAGGSARAIAFCLLNAGVARLSIANRTAERATALVADTRTRFPAARVEALPLEGAAGLAPDLLVNSTTLGMASNATGAGRNPVDLARLGVREAVVDIVYNPLETPLLAQAHSLGLPCTNGIGMLLYQGGAAFRFWTDREPPLEAMRAALPTP